MIRDDDALRLARSRFERAKLEYTAAAKAALRRDAGAALQASRALAELNAARAELNRLEGGRG